MAATELDALETILKKRIAAAQKAWPGVHVEPERFLSYLAARLPDGASLADGLATLRCEDLYLACACSQGDNAALAALENQYSREIRQALSRLGLAATESADLQQVLREKLFVGKGGAPPRITEYSGRGALRGWLRAAAVRTALNLLEGRKKHLPLDQVVARLPAASNPELDHLKRTYRAEFKRAFEEVLLALSDRERTLLREHFVEGLNIDHIAAAHGVHRATAARWLAQLRDSVLSATKASLRRRLRVSSSQLTSIMRLIRSQLDISIQGFLKP